MTLEQLRIFVAVADSLHVTRAAQSLNITQSAASASIAALETRHGMRLFHRIGRRIELTEAGRSFLPEAKAVLARAASTRQISEATPPVSGVITGVSSLPSKLRPRSEATTSGGVCGALMAPDPVP